VTIVVLLILAVIWALVLGPGLLRSRAERRARDSIGAFHRQLRVLERTGPTLVSPAFRLRTRALAEGSGALATARSGVGLDDDRDIDPEDVTVRARRLRPPVAERGLLVVRPDRVAPRTVGDPTAHRRADPFFRAQACRRRRNVLAGFACIVVLSGLLGSVPVLRPLLFVTAAAVVVSALYVALLVRLRTRAVEREVKLRYLPQPAAYEQQIVVRRSAAH